MSLLSLIAALIAVGVLLWLVNTYVPMDAKIKNILLLDGLRSATV